MRLDPLPIWLAVLAMCFGIVAAVCLLTTTPAHCIELNISGHSIGQGMQNLSFVGDLINVSILQNSSFQGWNITIQGATA